MMNKDTIEQRLDEALGSFDEATRRDIKQQVLPVTQELIEEALLDQLKAVDVEEGDIVLFTRAEGYTLPPTEMQALLMRFEEEIDVSNIHVIEGLDLETATKEELERALEEIED